MICVRCQKEIRDDQRPYYSRQAGMRGRYHWECFVEACREINRYGEKMLATVLAGVRGADALNILDHEDHGIFLN